MGYLRLKEEQKRHPNRAKKEQRDSLTEQGRRRGTAQQTKKGAEGKLNRAREETEGQHKQSKGGAETQANRARQRQRPSKYRP